MFSREGFITVVTSGCSGRTEIVLSVCSEDQDRLRRLFGFDHVIILWRLCEVSGVTISQAAWTGGKLFEHSVIDQDVKIIYPGSKQSL